MSEHRSPELESHPFPILEHDPATTALIEPRSVIRTPAQPVPERCVLCFFQDVIEGLCDEGKAEQIARLRSEIGYNAVYRVELEGQPVTVLHPGVGAPLAAAFLEEAIALGCRRVIACGGAGVLDSSIAPGHLMVPDSAIRDEGTSYHYLPPARVVEASPEGVAAIERVLQRRGVAYLRARTWTTDGIYRETPARIAARRAEGCLTVEMEAAAFFAVGRFRGVSVAQILYGGDDVGGIDWDHRSWDRHPVRETVFWLAVEACLEM